MQNTEGQDPLFPPSNGTIVIPGNLDGVHLGHRALIAQAKSRVLEERKRSGSIWQVAALTFDPHPLRILKPERAPIPLTSPSERAALLRDAGVDLVLIKKFDEDFANLSARTFVERVLVGELNAKGVLIGNDFLFGKNREGTPALLNALGQEFGFFVQISKTIEGNGETISSSRIRKAIGDGKVELAAQLLGRFHRTHALVIQGDQRGRTIGFPTANLGEVATLLPGHGVYAVRVRIEGQEPWLDGVANIGLRPTFAAGLSAEIHCLDFSGDLYGQHLDVQWISKLRDEQKFAGLLELKTQIAVDVQKARTVLSQELRIEEIKNGDASWT